MKRILYVLLGIAVVAGIATLAAGLYADRIARVAIERGGTYALGVETTLDSARLGLMSGRFGLSGLTVANPEGFGAPSFLTLKRGEAAVGSLRDDPIVIERIELEGVGVTLERGRGGTNYAVILRNLERLSGGPPDPQAETAESTGVVVRELVIRDVGASVRLLPGADLTRLDVEIPEIRLTDLGARTPGGMELAELTGVVTRAILTAVARRSGALPGDMAGELTRRLGRLGRLPIDLPVPERAESAAGELQERLGEAGEKAGETIEGLRGILGRD